MRRIVRILALMEHKSEPAVVALVGDVIASRHSGDREQLQGQMARATSAVNAVIPAIQPLMMTVGDEFQGLYAGMAAGFQAALRLRLALLPQVDVRIGIGWGPLTLQPQNPPFGQDGPCWWRAREAIGEVKEGEKSKSVPRSRRTLCITGTSSDGLLNGFLGLRDQVMVGLDEVDIRIANLRLVGKTQTEISDSVGLSQSSVSRRLHGHGLYVLLDQEPPQIPVASE